LLYFSIIKTKEKLENTYDFDFGGLVEGNFHLPPPSTGDLGLKI